MPVAADLKNVRVAYLFRHEAVVNVSGGHQGGMVAAFHDVPVVQGKDAVAINHAGQPVRQDQYGAVPHQAAKGLLDDGLVFGVHRGQRLVKYEDRCVAQQGAGDGHALPLAAAELDALLPDQRLVTFRQRHDEAVNVGGAGGGHDLVVRGVRPAHADVILDIAVEQVGIL